MAYHNGFILARSEWLYVTGVTHPLRTKGLNHVTLLQQIRLWMRTRGEGKQLHDCENDPLIEPYFDLSPEATLPPESSGALLEEDR
jgi:hypothetical protein